MEDFPPVRLQLLPTDMFDEQFFTYEWTELEWLRLLDELRGLRFRNNMEPIAAPMSYWELAPVATDDTWDTYLDKYVPETYLHSRPRMPDPKLIGESQIRYSGIAIWYYWNLQRYGRENMPIVQANVKTLSLGLSAQMVREHG